MSIGKLYRLAMAALLFGLMFFDKPFAYLGIGPLFITEIVLLLGLVAAFMHVRHQGLAGWQRISRLQMATLAVFLTYEGARTAFDVPRFGVLALRDGVVWGYLLFAVIIVTIAHRETVRSWISNYRRIAPIFVIWVPMAVLLFALRPGELTIPGHSVSLYLFKPGDLLVHLSGAGAALALWPRTALPTSLRRIANALIALAWGTGFVMAASLSRGGLAACLAGLAVVVVLGPWKQVVKLAAGALVALLLFGVSGIQITCPAIAQGALNKEISARQILTQVSSTLRQAARLLPSGLKTRTPATKHVRRTAPAKRMRRTALPSHVTTSSSRRPPAKALTSRPPSPAASPAKNLRKKMKLVIYRERLGTIRWRLDWWRKIIGYTVGGPYALWGKGFGINLADADGFQPEKNHGLRDPHNVFMTFLARSGVPGLTLFVILIGVVLINLFIAWRQSGQEDRRVAVWLSAYLAAMLVNACFDVYIENPMGGVWFWTMIGAAIIVSANHRRPRRGAETPQ